MSGPTIRAVLLFAIAAIATYLAAPTMAYGEWFPLPNVNDPEIQELGRWAIEEHVKQAKDEIKFNKLVSGKEQVGEGVNLDLIIDAWNRDGNDAKYEAKLHLRDWMDKHTLVLQTS